MLGIDRIYVALRVLLGHAVKVETSMVGPDNEMTVTFIGGQLARPKRKSHC